MCSTLLILHLPRNCEVTSLPSPLLFGLEERKGKKEKRAGRPTPVPARGTPSEAATNSVRGAWMLLDEADQILRGFGGVPNSPAKPAVWYADNGSP